MKKIFLFILAATFVASVSSFKPLHVDEFKANTTLSSFFWVGKKTSGEHSGRISLKEGVIANDHGRLSARFVMDMNTITTTDIKGDKAKDLDDHLKDPDFFDVANHPTATLVTTSISPIQGAAPGANNFKVTGNLTIKGITHPVAFETMLSIEAGKVVAKGDIIIDRSKYDVRYKSKSFFENLGDKFIYDEFTITFNLIAEKQNANH